ncbi:hypothetical protein ABEY63_23380 [Priestia aryabhattai]|uniref:Uncharacterized protein n=1 Tax=Priestia megaterium TaxID=1404 RepID=A0AAX6BSV3_PRIMG|nr:MULTISPECIES: hypothetical protein [Priestia]MCM2978929.1 hypothetical protein [Priestia aryabhattai]MEB4858310.1 hypothetical protein [Priestia megaterium]MED3923165.1 hypothetical protein [Priestia aryabhattai]MED4008728.1 hypothetical protein [Priestia aryabhattai]MED4014306.1 hypothetical protein [Priestia aryabhattai]
MFESTLVAELTKRIGTPVEIALADGFVEGIITAVTNGLITILQTVGYGYGGTTLPLTIAFPSITSIKISPVA